MKSIRSIVAIGAAIALAAGSGACDGQATPDYQGVPLARLHGTIATGPTTAMPSDLVAGLSWVLPVESPGSNPLISCGVATPGPVPIEVPVTGTFPARFALDMFTPPPSGVMAKEGIARATVVVFEKATGKVWGTTMPDAQLVYIASTFAPDTFVRNVDLCVGWGATDYWDKTSHPSGYYLLQATKDCLRPMGAPGPGLNTKALQEAPQGLATELTIDLKLPESQQTGSCPVNMMGGQATTQTSGAP